tara:strand:+ start:342 stop:1466 length:1125 start_codon:yes stop_codon:yes gene_type:complete
MSHGGHRRKSHTAKGSPSQDHDDDNPYFASVGLGAGASGGGGPSSSNKPPTSRARLLKETDAEEKRSAAARVAAQSDAKRTEEKVLKMKAQRSQVGAKLAEWEEAFAKSHGRQPTASDKQKSSQHKELTKLCTDLDRFISAAQTGSSPLLLAADTLADEKKAERGKLKAKMRRWDRDFERERGRRPREEDREASEEFIALRSRLQVLDDSGDVSNRSGGGSQRGGDAGGGGAGGAGGAALMGMGGGGGMLAFGAPSFDRLNPGGWWGGGEYYQLVMTRVQSRADVAEFDHEPKEEVQAAAAMFVQYDMDRDGVVGLEEFLLVMSSLAQRSGRVLSNERIQKLFAVADRDGNGVVDFGEFLILEQKKKAMRGGGV